MCLFIRRVSFLVIFSLLLNGCSGFFEKDNTPQPMPLTAIHATVIPTLLWSQNAGKGPGKEYLKFQPVLVDNVIYTASINGLVTAFDKSSGKVIWQMSTLLPLVSGPGVGDGIIALASRKGNIWTINAQNGKPLWQTTMDGEVLAAPAVGHGKVIVKSTDGYVRAFDSRNGALLWSYMQDEPQLILHAASSPLIDSQFDSQKLIIGFANGDLVKLNASDGQLLWQQGIAEPDGAFAIDRMVDIDADPIIYGHHIFAATYQGNLASLDWQSGAVLWSYALSSYTGMATDGQSIYVSDARSFVWGFNAKNGAMLWILKKLYARGVTTPVILNQYVIVGDREGFLHWISTTTGQIAGRIAVGAPVYAAPIVDPISSNRMVYILTSKGRLNAYSYAE